MKCTVLIKKLNYIKTFWEEVQCDKNAKYIIKYKINNIMYTKLCCTIHKNILLKEINDYSFAELISVDNITQ